MMVELIIHNNALVNDKLSVMITHCRIQEYAMGLAATEAELAGKTAQFLKAELKRADVTYEELAERLKEHGLAETKASIANKLSRRTIGATFLLATLAALGIEALRLEDL
jgi:Domain of unknown function (DUF6471)